MDTLVAVGTTAAWAYSVFVTIFPTGRPRGGPPPGDVLRLVDDHHRTRPARPLARGRARRRAHGRRDPPARGPRSRRPPGVVADGDERDVALDEVRARRPAAGPAGRQDPGRRRRRRRAPRRRRVDAHRRAAPGRRGSRRRRSSAARSTARARSSSGRPASAPRPPSPGSSTSSSAPRAARRRSSGWPTGSARSSCRSSC